MLHEMLARLAKEYTYERAKPFAKSEFGDFVRHDVSIEAKKRLIYLPYELKVKASVGAGVWAAVPWLAFFDPLETDTATRGIYVVYLINPQTQEIYLSLNQGTTQTYEEFGESRGREVLRRRAIDIKERVPEFSKVFESTPIELGSATRLPLGYEAGHAFGRKYLANNIDATQFDNDLEKMLAAYSALIDRGGRIPFDALADDAGSSEVEEVRRYALSKRIERAGSVRGKVLEQRGAVCEACELDPSKDYGFTGPLKKMPLDVHHCKPIHHLAEGESRRYTIPDDFLVLCPTCHRMIHKQADPSDLDLLRRKIMFKHAREVTYRL